PRTTLFTYPDASIICGELQYDPRDKSRQTVLNPVVIVEVLSPSTEAYDRGAKFASYMQIESLKEYVLFSQDAPRIETFLRQPEGAWRYLPAAGLETIARIESIEVQLALADVYEGVTFPEPSPPPEATAQP
ncbi:MAG TPA: Uma2 family endonuclease, partial [Tepidisphaeraceae bacterium]|nr:Uma2 family endonuclease [Tepidisphaeraceae bacterium]